MTNKGFELVIGVRECSVGGCPIATVNRGGEIDNRGRRYEIYCPLLGELIHPGERGKDCHEKERNWRYTVIDQSYFEFYEKEGHVKVEGKGIK